MKRNLKKALSILLCMIIMFGTVAVGGEGFAEVLDAFSVKAGAANIISGSCGDNVTYTLNKVTGLLTISGTGKMNDYGWTDSPFYYNTLIKSVVIETGVTSIGNRAFAGCTGLTSITIPNSVTSIGERAFEKCTGLVSITIPNSVTSIDHKAFYYCTGLTSITIPNSVTSIGDAAFYQCYDLTSITIPDSVTSIGSSAFSYCTDLTSITIPNSVTSIGSSAFYNTGYYNKKDNWENRVLYIGNHLITADINSISGSYSIKNGTITIAEFAFSDAFRGCKGLTSITIPNSVTSIGEGAFEYCTGLKIITIPDSVTSIGGEAFRGCTGLTSVTIGNSVTSIGEAAFAGCSSLTSVKVDSGNTVYDSRENCNAIIKTSTNELIAGCQNTIIPNSVTSIGFGAFSYCTGLTSITIPNSVTSIGDYAFLGCSDDMIIFGFTGSTAENYAENNGFIFAPLDNNYEISYEWSEDGNTCVATAVDKNNVVKENATVTSKVKTPATCKEKGTTTYIAAFTNELFATQTKDIVDIAPINHNYEVSYDWAEDGKTCVATATCKNNKSHVVTENATVTSKVKIPATCEEKGTTTYTAAFTNELFATQTKDIFDIAQINNNYEISYEWSEDGKTCVATAADKNNKDDVVKENATVTFKVKAPATCEEKGTTTYTAEFTNELFETQTKDIVDIALANHSFTNYVYNNNAHIGVDGTETAKCDRCTAIDTRTKVGSAKASPVYAIRNMSKYNGKTIELKSSLTIYADVQNCTDVKWFVTGAKYTPNADGSITINQATTDFSVYFTAKDLDGNTVTSETETVKVKTGFFAMLVAFFKGLFKALPDLKQ